MFLPFALLSISAAFKQINVRHTLIMTKKKHTNSGINSKETKIVKNRRRRRKRIRKGQEREERDKKNTHTHTPPKRQQEFSNRDFC